MHQFDCNSTHQLKHCIRPYFHRGSDHFIASPPPYLYPQCYIFYVLSLHLMTLIASLLSHLLTPTHGPTKCLRFHNLPMVYHGNLPMVSNCAYGLTIVYTCTTLPHTTLSSHHTSSLHISCDVKKICVIFCTQTTASHTTLHHLAHVTLI